MSSLNVEFGQSVDEGFVRDATAGQLPLRVAFPVIAGFSGSLWYAIWRLGAALLS